MSNHHRWLASLGILLAVIPLSVSAQRGRGGRGASSDAPAEVGIPVLNADVQNACARATPAMTRT